MRIAGNENRRISQPILEEDEDGASPNAIINDSAATCESEGLNEELSRLLVATLKHSKRVSAIDAMRGSVITSCKGEQRAADRRAYSQPPALRSRCLTLGPRENKSRQHAADEQDAARRSFPRLDLAQHGALHLLVHHATLGYANKRHRRLFTLVRRQRSLSKRPQRLAHSAGRIERGALQQEFRRPLFVHAIQRGEARGRRASRCLKSLTFAGFSSLGPSNSTLDDPFRRLWRVRICARVAAGRKRKLQRYKRHVDGDRRGAKLRRLRVQRVRERRGECEPNGAGLRTRRASSNDVAVAVSRLAHRLDVHNRALALHVVEERSESARCLQPKC